MWKGGWWEEGVLGVEVEGRLVGGGCVRCGRGKYEEVEGRLAEGGMLDVEGVNMKKLKAGWWRRVC